MFLHLFETNQNLYTRSLEVGFTVLQHICRDYKLAWSLTNFLSLSIFLL